MYRIWDSTDSPEDVTEIEAETPCQAAFFVANERKPSKKTEFVVALDGTTTVVQVVPNITYTVSELHDSDELEAA